MDYPPATVPSATRPSAGSDHIQRIVDQAVEHAVAEAIKPAFAAVERKVEEMMDRQAETHKLRMDSVQDNLKSATQEVRGIATEFRQFIKDSSDRLGQLSASDTKQDNRLNTLEDRLSNAESRWTQTQRQVDLIERSNAELTRELRGDQSNPSPIQALTNEVRELKKLMNEYTSQQVLNNRSLQTAEQKIPVLEDRISKTEQYINNRKNLEQLLFTGGMMFWKNKWWFISLLILVASIMAMVLQLQR